MKAGDRPEPRRKEGCKRRKLKKPWQMVYTVVCLFSAFLSECSRYQPCARWLSSKLCLIPALSLWPISSVSLHFHTLRISSGFLGGSVAKNSLTNVGVTGDSGSIPGSEEMETYSIILAWRIPWIEEPGGLQSLGSQRVVHNWATEQFPHNTGLLKQLK